MHLLRSRNLAAAGATAYEAHVRYRTSMLVPDGATKAASLAGGSRVVTMSGALPSGG